MTGAPEGRVITRVVCPQGHLITEVIATIHGLVLYARHASVGAHSRRATPGSIVDRGRTGEMLARLHQPRPGDFVSIEPRCLVCGHVFQLSLDELWDWASDETRRVVAVPRP